MRTSTRLLVATAIGGALILTGCASGGEATGSGDGGQTIAVDVGTDTPVQLPTGQLRIGIFTSAMTNQWYENAIGSLEDSAKAAGAQVQIFDANYDVATQQNQLQTAAANHSVDVAIVLAVDGVQICDVVTKTLPEANILPVVSTAPICGRTDKVDDELWAPGTLDFVGADATRYFYDAWVKATGDLVDGPQRVLVVAGLENTPYTTLAKDALEGYEADHPDFQVVDYLYTDWTTPTAYNATLNYLQANPDIDTIMSVYTPDTTRGIVQALEAAGQLGQYNITDIGGAEYTVEQIKNGNVTASLPFAPQTMGEVAIQSIYDAQGGKSPVRWVNNLPADFGTPTDPLVVTSANVDSFTPQF